MRKFILSTLAVAAMAAPLAAQPAPGEIRNDRRDVRQEQREVRGDERRGDYREARDDRRDLRDARSELRDDRRDRFDDRRGDDRRDGDRGRDGYRGDRDDRGRPGWNGDHRPGGWDGRRYNAGRYDYPRGYAYRAWNVGGFLPRSYWGSQYYIGRPAFYGLPVAYSGARWVRVGPDALLIRVRDGAVLRVERARFY